MSDRQSSPLALAALGYAAMGVPVFPLVEMKKRPKIARTEGGRGFHDATTNLQVVSDWWRRWPNANIGAATGVLFDVIDLDGSGADAALASTYPDGWPPSVGCVLTPRPGGRHLYVPVIGAPTKGGVAPHVDARGLGGYVVLPPSVLDEEAGVQHAGTYRWESAPPSFRAVADAPLPAYGPWRRLWEAPVAPPRTITATGAFVASAATTTYGARALTGECTKVTQAAQGSRNDTLNRAAFRVGQLVPHEITEADASQALRDAARTCGLAAGEASATITSGLRSGMGQPRQRAERADDGPALSLAGLHPAYADTPPGVAASPAAGAPAEGVAPMTLADAESVFQRWFGTEYDLDAMRAVLATAAVERLDGDPLWLLLISGSGNAKTETVGALARVATITSTITSEGALLSATSRRERTKDATGGLLRKLGSRGVLVIKDVTSILSMNRDLRGQVLAALREVYDGQWSRNVGSDGGQTLTWDGRLAVIGAVTTAWDTAHAVIASMGDRFVLLRMDSTTGRQSAGRRAIANTGREVEMRADLATAVAGVLACMSASVPVETDAERDMLLGVADLVTRARTAVERDYQGNVIDAHAPEMPTRFAKQLTQVVRGAVAIGMERPAALQLAIRCARDSTPPLRLAILDDLAEHPASTTTGVRRRLERPRSTVDRELQALYMLELLTVDEAPWGAGGQTRWHYSLANGVNPAALHLKTSPSLSVDGTWVQRKAKEDSAEGYLVTDKPGDVRHGGAIR